MKVYKSVLTIQPHDIEIEKAFLSEDIGTAMQKVSFEAKNAHATSVLLEFVCEVEDQN